MKAKVGPISLKHDQDCVLRHWGSAPLCPPTVDVAGPSVA